MDKIPELSNDKKYGLKVFRNYKEEPGVMRPLYSNVNRGAGSLFNQTALDPKEHQYRSGETYNYRDMSTSKEDNRHHTPPGYSAFNGTTEAGTLNDVVKILNNIDPDDMDKADIVIKPILGTEILKRLHNVRHSPRHGYYSDMKILEPEVVVPYHELDPEIDKKRQDRQERRERTVTTAQNMYPKTRQLGDKIDSKLKKIYAARKAISNIPNLTDDEIDKKIDEFDVAHEAEIDSLYSMQGNLDNRQWHNIAEEYPNDRHLLFDDSGPFQQDEGRYAFLQPTERTDPYERNYMPLKQLLSILRKNARKMKNPETDPPSDWRIKEPKIDD
jgi:hypothetical protein